MWGVSKAAREELEHIRKFHKGLLKPEDVVEFAKNKNTALYKYFQWNDTEAARLYRLEQAQEVIRVCVVVMPGNEEPIRAYVSILDERGTNDGAYRLTDDVMKSKQWREQLVKEALFELDTFRLKYGTLISIFKFRGLFREIESLTRRKKAKAA